MASDLRPSDLTYVQRLRFWQRFEIADRTPKACWDWQGDLDKSGYGKIRYKRDLTDKWFQTHRLAYQLMVGEVPDGLQLDHLCRNRACGNPDHLEPVTLRENQRRSPLHGNSKTHCKYGHPFDEENTLISKRGWRICRACKREDNRRRAAARREGAA